MALVIDRGSFWEGTKTPVSRNAQRVCVQFPHTTRGQSSVRCQCLARGIILLPGHAKPVVAFEHGFVFKLWPVGCRLSMMLLLHMSHLVVPAWLQSIRSHARSAMLSIGLWAVGWRWVWLYAMVYELCYGCVGWQAPCSGHRTVYAPLPLIVLLRGPCVS